MEAEGQDTEFPDVTPPLTERKSDLKKELEAVQEKVKKQGEKTKRLKAKNRKLKEQVAAKKEVATSDSKILHLMYIDVKSPEHVQNARRYHAENLIKNCGTCNTREAGTVCQSPPHSGGYHPSTRSSNKRRTIPEKL